MKTLSIVGILLIVLGIAAFAYQGITYTTQEKVVDLGPLQMTAEKTRTIPAAPDHGRDRSRGRHRTSDCGKKECLAEYLS
jgi:hypothetical protein